MSVRREIGRRVVSEKVLGSSNPVARWGRQTKSTCWDSIGGFFIGILLFFATFYLPYTAAHTEKDSKDVSKLDVISVEQAASFTGKALVQGTIMPQQQLTVPLAKDATNVLAFEYILEHWETWTETHDETHTETRNGKDIEVTEQVTEDVSGWKVKKDDTQWAVVKVGQITIDHERCKLDLPWETAYSNEYSNKSSTGEDKYRETVKIIRGGVQVLLAAELASGQVAAEPDFNRVYPGTKDQLVATMNSEEETSRWGFIIASVILWTISFNLMIGPAFFLFNIFPVKEIGCAIRGIYTFFSLLMACFLTWITYVMIRYWWLIAVLLVGIAVVLIVLASRNRKRAAPDLEAPGSEPTEPTQ
jgi:hypothetical protein